MSNDEKKREPEKFFTVIYRSNGEVDVTSNLMTVFDLWSLASYIKMRADEMYITTQTANRMKEANSKDLVRAATIPDHLRKRD